MHAQFPIQQYPVYNGSDLGLTYTQQASTFKIWSPTATEAEILLFKDGSSGHAYKSIPLQKGEHGTWFKKLDGNLKGMFYAFRVNIKGNWSDEVIDPYAKADGTNGRRGVVADLTTTNPAGWAMDKSPAFSNHNLPTDAVIYELHIRDASISNNSGIVHKGKYAGLTETGTSYKGVSTGLSHLKELGVTHIHLLPFFDYNSVDESKPGVAQYNWGYDPLNYNIPEGSYSSNPADGVTRIKELKELVAGFHKNGLRIVMDVVYNHTGQSQNSNFNQLVPGYYYRHKKDGSFSDATACGNETASEMPMMRKFMLESLVYWVKEYHIDGFRFDLMGVHDIETMNIISKELHKIKPDILLYGEGWTAGASPLSDSLRALKANAAALDKIAVFSDDVRDGLKGSVFEEKDNGFVSGKIANTESVKFGIVAACQHPQIDYSKVNYSKKPYAAAPGNVITYVECHDNNTLWDKLALSNPTASITDREQMQKLALTIVLTSQGIPFLHAGTEFFRSKKGVENSYNRPDSINEIDWSQKKKEAVFVKYVEHLIQIRKAHPAFRMSTTKQVADNIRFEENAPEGMIIYTINGTAMHDSWRKIYIAFNGKGQQQKITLPPGHWKNAMNSKGTFSQQAAVTLGKYAALILYQN
ncbi:type I pullulanase [soil metagenome]